MFRSGGDFDIESFYFGYDASNVFIRVDASTTEELANASDEGAFNSPDLAIYFMQPNAVNFNEAETNFRTYYGNQILGFPSKYMVAFDFDTVREDGRAKWNLFSAQGKVGEQERWVLSGSSNLGGTASPRSSDSNWSDPEPVEAVSRISRSVGTPMVDTASPRHPPIS